MRNPLPVQAGRQDREPGRRFRRTFVFGLALVVILGIGGGALFLWPRPLNTKTVCIYTRNVDSFAAFSNLPGTPVNCSVLYNDANPGWAQWVDPCFTLSRADRLLGLGRRGPRPTLVSAGGPAATEEMVPDDVPANWRVLGAEGAYDWYMLELAVNLVAAGMGNAVIRLGHEMNGDLIFDHSLGNDPAQYRGLGRVLGPDRAGDALGPRAPTSCSTGTSMPGTGTSRSARSYPGNDVVDVIGVDVYDSGMPGGPQ